jgi:hypothetical protein
MQILANPLYGSYDCAFQLQLKVGIFYSNRAEQMKSIAVSSVMDLNSLKSTAHRIQRPVSSSIQKPGYCLQ